MKHIISKTVKALWPGGHLLEDDFFKRVRERLHTHDPYSQNEDYGIQQQKKTIVAPTGFGANDRGTNPGAGIGLGRDENESKDHSLSSGYNDGEQAQDDTGPGYTPYTSDPYYGSDVLNGLFLDLKLNTTRDRDSVQKHLKTLLKQQPIAPKRKGN